MRRSKRAFSSLISTVLLTSVLLSITVVATFLAQDILNTQMAASEFRSSEQLAITLDSEVRKLMFKPGASTVVKVSFFLSAIGFNKSGELMNVTFPGTPSRYYLIPVNFLNLEGGHGMGGVFGYDVQGDRSLVVSPSNGSLGRIFLDKPRDWRLSIDYGRLLCTFTGLVNQFNGTLMNTVEVTSVVLDFGTFDVTQNCIIVLRNENVVTDTFMKAGNFQLVVSRPGLSKTLSLDEIGGNPSYSTVLRFHRVYMKVTVLEGA